MVYASQYMTMIYFILDEILSKLRQDVWVARRAAYNDGTLRHLHIQFKAYLLFCLYFHIDASPVSLDVLCIYVRFLGRSLGSVENVANYINGLKLMQLSSGFDFPDMHSFEYKKLVMGMTHLYQDCSYISETGDTGNM